MAALQWHTIGACAEECTSSLTHSSLHDFINSQENFVGVQPRPDGLASICRANGGLNSDAALLLRDVGISLPELPTEDMDEESNEEAHRLQAGSQAEAVLAAMAADVPLRRALLQVRAHCAQHDDRRLRVHRSDYLERMGNIT